MARVPLVLLSLLYFLSPASAALAHWPDSPPPGRDVPASLVKSLPPGLAQTASAPSPKDQYQITDQTEVTLNGRRCRYADVPAGAGIVKMEVAADGTTVLKIHFQTRR
jgi:hypothetical protein